MSKKIIGTVVSNAMDKSAVVAVETSKTHPIYKKRYKTTKRFLVHDAENTARLGDLVEISETRPMSARKHFEISQTLKAAPAVEPQAATEPAKPTKTEKKQ